MPLHASLLCYNPRQGTEWALSPIPLSSLRFRLTEPKALCLVSMSTSDIILSCYFEQRLSLSLNIVFKKKIPRLRQLMIQDDAQLYELVQHVHGLWDYILSAKETSYRHHQNQLSTLLVSFLG